MKRSARWALFGAMLAMIALPYFTWRGLARFLARWR